MPSPLPPGFLVLPAHGDRTLFQLKKKLGLLVLHELLTVPATSASHARFRAWLEQSLRSSLRAEVRRAADRTGCSRTRARTEERGGIDRSRARRGCPRADCRTRASRGGTRRAPRSSCGMSRSGACSTRTVNGSSFSIRRLSGSCSTARILEIRTADGASYPFPLDEDLTAHPSVCVERPFHSIATGAVSLLLFST